ncbi:cytochrome c peroxidase [Reichenbachiella sp. MALMAid0571]|uniref:cytochrome-c peroxidase n=1 Tax=Reichenbachiella sp. MALMAid0571 TaxID=3143939 RepID=UPI0032DF7B0F
MFRYCFMGQRNLKKPYYILIVLVLAGCSKVDEPTKLELNYPSFFPKPKDFPVRNPLTVEGVELGRMLFYDPALSASGKISCATCHLQQLSFSDGQKLSSSGISGNMLKRNSPALINLAWMDNLFWDGGVKNLESLPFAALTSSDEMGGDLKEIVKYLNENAKYKKRFQKTFGINQVSSAYIARALAQFQRTLVSANSKYDQVQRGENQFLEDELKGQKIFIQKCSSCHIPPLFTDNLFHNNGIDDDFPIANEDVRAGRYRITLDSMDLGKFKTPTLRNLKYTAPYMHDGRFESLRNVINHYQNGMKESKTLSNTLIDFHLEDQEANLILVFLATLNDEAFTENLQFAP